MSGLFLTFEGGDGSGKSTLLTALEAHFKREQRPLLMTREPGGTPLGERLREVVLQADSKCPIGSEAELLLFLAARAQNIEEAIRPALQRGELVLCDRFHESTIAYQGAGREMGIERVSRLCQQVSPDLKPTKTFLLDLPPAIGLERSRRVGTADRMEEEKLRFHEAVREAYLYLAAQEPERIQVIDAKQTQEAVFQEVLGEIELLLGGRVS